MTPGDTGNQSPEGTGNLSPGTFKESELRSIPDSNFRIREMKNGIVKF